MQFKLRATEERKLHSLFKRDSRKLQTSTSRRKFEPRDFNEAFGRKLPFYIMATFDVEVALSPADIPGAELSEPFDKHTLVELRWWLLCRGIRAPNSWRKQQVIERYDVNYDHNISFNMSV